MKAVFISLTCLIFLLTGVAEKWRPSTLRWTPPAVGGEPGLRAAPFYAAALLLPVRPPPAAAAPGRRRQAPQIQR